MTAPTPVSPVNDFRLNDRRPTLRVANSQGRFVGSNFSYEFVVLTMGGAVVRGATVGGGNGTTQWVYPSGTELQGNTRYQWRARAVLDGTHGPWSPLATFQTVSAPPNCEARPLEADRTACVATVAATSEEWRRCAAGSGVACHRFSREVARALAMGDPNWGLLGKPQGVQQCTMERCGSNVRGGYGEDIVAYCRFSTCGNRFGPNGRNDWVAIDIVLGAGAPGARFHWGPIAVRNNRGNNFWAPVP